MKGTLAPRIIGIVVSLIAIVAFFLPFISATPDYAKYTRDLLKRLRMNTSIGGV